MTSVLKIWSVHFLELMGKHRSQIECVFSYELYRTEILVQLNCKTCAIKYGKNLSDKMIKSVKFFNCVNIIFLIVRINNLSCTTHVYKSKFILIFYVCFSNSKIFEKKVTFCRETPLILNSIVLI